MPTSLARTTRPRQQAQAKQKKYSLNVVLNKTARNYKFRVISTDHYLPLLGLVCFRFDCRDVVNTVSVCSHLCRHQWHGVNGLVGNVVLPQKRAALFGGDDVIPTDIERRFQGSSNFSPDILKITKAIFMCCRHFSVYFCTVTSCLHCPFL